jgi:hypothetical protein
MSNVELALICVVVAGAAWAVGKWLFKKDTEIEDRRKGAGQLAIVLGQYGLTRIPKFLVCYSVGDYSGCAKMIKDLADLFMSGQGPIIEEFDGVFKSVLAAKLQTEEGRAYIKATLEEALNPDFQ